MPRFLRGRSAVFLVVFLISAAGLFGAVHERLVNASLEDDVLWFVPLLKWMTAHLSWRDLIRQMHAGELTLIDGAYFALVPAFGFRFNLLTWISLGVHLANALFLFSLLKNRLRLEYRTSAVASLIYLVFYGHFHAYTFLMAFHHLAAVFFFLAGLYFYLGADERIEDGRLYILPYITTLLISLPAAVQRLSILILPAMILAHLLYASRDKEKVIRKFTLWMPLFIIFPAYQMAVLLSGGQGDVLDRFLKPFFHFFPEGKTGIPAMLCMVASAMIGMLLLVRAGLKFFLNHRPLELLQRWIFRGACLVVVMPILLVLCLGLFVRPVDSAILPIGYVAQRWQRLANPVTGPALWAAYGIGWAMLLAGLRHAQETRRGLVIFFVWYIAVNFFFLRYDEDVPSRYLIYLAPVFAVLFSILLCETIPQIMRRPLLRWGYGCILTVFLVALWGMNLFAISLRSATTLLVDYHWNYDYIKAARLIRYDLVRRFGPGYRGLNGICISGVGEIPYAHEWEKAFLKNMPFERFEPFRQTLYGVLGNDTVSVVVNEECDSTWPSYTLTGATVISNGRHIEAFYESFEEGFDALRRGDIPKAREKIGRAAAEKSFLFKFMRVPPLFSRGPLAGLFRKNLANAVYGTYAAFYDGDDKINAIDTLIRHEVYDYGLALALSAYWSDQENPQAAEDWLREVGHYVTRRGLEEYLVERRVDFPGIEDFQEFLNRRAGHFPTTDRELAWEDMEHYHGFRIYSYQKFYFTQPAQQEVFDLSDYKSGLCSQCIAARTRREARRAIAPLILPEASSNNKEPQMISREGQYVIFQAADAFYVLAQRDMSGSVDTGAVMVRAMFRCTTLAEAKASIHLAESFPDTVASGHRQVPGLAASASDAFLAYRLSWMGLTIGRLDIQTVPAVYEGRPVIEKKAELRPPVWIGFVSSGRVGLDAGAILDPVLYLPYEYTQTDSYSHQKGKAPRRIVYHHDQLFMERKGHEEDILADTRDHVSVFHWLTAQDYSRQRWIKTTLNFNRALYLLVGRVYPIVEREKQGDVLVSVKIQPLVTVGSPGRILPIEGYLMKSGGTYVPVLLSVGTGIRSFQFMLTQ